METQLRKADFDSIKDAAALMKKGEVVGIPTETVYGIAANSFDADAIKKIFIAKNRPQDNPLIVHISDMDMLHEVVSYVSEDAKKMMAAFWPGALTIIMPKSERVPLETTAGLDSVGVRMPSHPVAHQLICACGFPFSAPSANRSGRPSPTTAQDVFEDMNGRIPLILDGGESFAGVESTVISVLGETPVILRPGVVTKEMIEHVLGKKILVSKAITHQLEQGEKALSPGMKYKHYAPNAEITILVGSFEIFKEYVESRKDDAVFCLCFDGEETKLNLPCITYGKQNDPDAQAHLLFSALRELDKAGAKIVYARCPGKDGVSLAVYNRLIRAAGFRVVTL
ncbi:MAG: threonylcarbamoyl-AMP synthase [Lachnospiraceae bacterium]|nr:threonylcarbamoyl-AMP synthase [Lachnospiraceae bacterium]